MVLLLKLCAFMGLIPSGSKTRLLVTSIITSIWYIICFYYRLELYYDFPIKLTVVDVVAWLTDFIFINACYSLVFKKSAWEDLVLALQKVDNSKGMMNTALLASLLLYFIAYCIESYVWFSRIQYHIALTYTCHHMTTLHQLLFMELVITLLKMLKEQYNGVKEQVSRLYSHQVNSMDVKNIAKAYYHLNQLTKTFNYLFEYQIFIVFAIFVSEFVIILSFSTLTYLQIGNGYLVFLSNFTFLGLFAVSTWRMLLAGEGVEDVSRSLEESCHELLILRNINPVLKFEILILARNFKVLAPKITAARFYNINRKILLNITSMITTYFIVFLQFK